jgi:hypothetical protein
MENPQGRMRHSPLLKALPHHRRVTVSYCKYGFDYRKHTDIWTNDFAWIPSPMCSAASPCDSVVDGRHPVAVRAHPGQETGPKTLHERYRIPPLDAAAAAAAAAAQPINLAQGDTADEPIEL